MCGICGIVSTTGRPPASSDLHAMARVLFHRGPDDEGYYCDGGIAFGFRRLSIVDLSGGHQPMSNEDGTVWIIYNGEIYNHAELRPELERRGHRYRTRSDTETILHAYEEYGDDCVCHFRGMFAFAIWDSRRRRLFCARDRLGIKPFYYSFRNELFVFGSEMKALFEGPGLSPEMNRAALPEFLALGYLSSDETMFAGVRKLLPGYRLSLELVPGAEPKVEQYWDLGIGTDDSLGEENECVTRFRDLFSESVRLRLMSDVPLGVFLSGGLDSSSIAATMAELVKGPIQTFSVGYAEDAYSELPWARRVAEYIGAEYNQVVLTPDDFFNSLPQLIWHEDEPLVWPSSVALHFVSRLAREKVKVVLTGEGADELLGGYLKYRVTRWNLQYGPWYRRAVPAPIRGALQSLLQSSALPFGWRRKLRHSFVYYDDRFEHLYFDNFYSVFPQGQQAELLTSAVADELRDTSAYANSMKFYPRNGKLGDELSRLLYLDIKTYLVELLMKQDQMSMAASIESRVPFLDHRLVEFVARIPSRHKLRFQSGKYLLRRAMAGKLPLEILNRTKLGFPTPLTTWLRGRLFDPVANVLTDGRLESRGVIRGAYVRELIQSHRTGRIDATDQLWRLLNFELWNRVFLDRDPGTLPSIPGGGRELVPA